VHACRSITTFGFPTASYYNYEIDVRTRNLPDMQRLSTWAMSSNCSTRSVPSIGGTTTVQRRRVSCLLPAIGVGKPTEPQPRPQRAGSRINFISRLQYYTNRPDLTIAMVNHQRLQRVMHHVRAATTAPPPSYWGPPTSAFGAGWRPQRVSYDARIIRRLTTK
jgi:hypothetical protein